MRYKCVIAYDGTDYSGWQLQPSEPSITGTLQQTFREIFSKEVRIIGASRTDAGVHAIGQRALCDTAIDLAPEKLQEIWNDRLPTSIVIRSMAYADDAYHPIYGVKQKTYWYHFFTKRPLPFAARYGWYIKQEVDMALLQKALALFVGTHDFRSFCTGNDIPGSTVRHIEHIDVAYDERFDAWRIVFVGPGFLRHMIRRIVGACMDVAAKRTLSVEALKEKLHACDPRQTLYNAPGHGLCLYKIVYKTDERE